MTGFQVKSDKGRLKGTRLLSCRDNLLVSTMNVNTLKDEWRMHELLFNCKKYGIDILGLQEHRFIHKNELNETLCEGYTMFTSSGYRNSMGAANGGVGVLLSRRAHAALTRVKSINDRILYVEFEGRNFPKGTILVCYSTTNCSDEEINMQFYEALSNTINAVPAHNVLLVIGDFNAQVGPEYVKHPYHSETNKNGRLLVDLAIENNLVIGNNHFQKKRGKLWTHQSNFGYRSQLDYILIRRKWLNSLKNVETYSSFSSVGSDHRIVTGRIQLSLRKAETQKQDARLDWYAFRSDKELQERFNIEIKKRFQILQTCEKDINTDYERFVENVKEVSEEILPTLKSRKKEKYSSDHRITTAREDLIQATLQLSKDRNGRSKQKYKRAKSNLRTAYEIVIEEDMEKKVTAIENTHANSRHRESWRLINDLSGRKSAKKSQIRGGSAKERQELWLDHFKSLLGGTSQDVSAETEAIEKIFDTLDISEEPFSVDELRDVKKALKEGKSSGEDGIPPEIIKRCDLDDILLYFCNKALEGLIPKLWTISNILPIPKTGDLTDPTNYRGISLTSVASKVFNKLILNRIRPLIEEKLRMNQNGYRVGRNTVNHILAARRLVEGVKNKNLSAVMVFIDFSKAFDSIDRKKMIQILSAYGIPKKILAAIEVMYSETFAKVISPDGSTELFKILNGVLQGDTLAPYIFVIVLDYALRKAITGREEQLGFLLESRKSRCYPAKYMTDLEFADDIMLVSNDITQAQKLLTCVEICSSEIGLQLNVKKTKCMVFNGANPNFQKLYTCGGKVVEVVEDFKYLGSYLFIISIGNDYDWFSSCCFGASPFR